MKTLYSRIKYDVFFKKTFYSIGDGLQQAMPAYAHGPKAHLHMSDDLALEISCIGYVQHDHGKKNQYVEEQRQDMHVLFLSLSGFYHVIAFYLSDSPRTTSRLPIFAIRSATREPSHKAGNELIWIKEGDLICMRYALGEPSEIK